MLNFISLCLFGLALVLSGCSGALGECDPSLPGSYCSATAAPETSPTPAVDSPTPFASPTPVEESPTPEATATPTPEATPPIEAQTCWDSVTFEIPLRYVNHGKAQLIATDWASLAWVDTDPVQILDASESTNRVTVYTSGDCGGNVEASLYLPTGYTMPALGDQYNNGIVAVLQPDGTVLEVNYLASCGNGKWQGYVLPDSNPQDACDEGIDSTRWLGAHGGSHFTATQAIRGGELTSSAPIGRPLPIEVDHTHLYYSASESDGHAGYRWPAASADGYAASENGGYSGTIPDLQMGSILVLPEDFVCTNMQTVPSQRLCEVARDHGFVVVDDSFGEDEVAFPITPEAQADVEVKTGIDLHNATGDFASDIEVLMASIQVLANPEEAWVK